MLLVTNSVQTSLTTLSSLTLPYLSCPPQHTQLHTATCCPAHNSTPQHNALHCSATMSQMHLSEVLAMPPPLKHLAHKVRVLNLQFMKKFPSGISWRRALPMNQNLSSILEPFELSLPLLQNSLWFRSDMTLSIN